MELYELQAMLNDMADFLDLAVADPLQAADALDGWARELQETANKLRQMAHDQQQPLHSDAVVNDRVKMRVIGPDGGHKATGGN